MATITAGEFRNGVTFEMDGKVMQVVEFQHVKPGTQQTGKGGKAMWLSRDWKDYELIDG